MESPLSSVCSAISWLLCRSCDTTNYTREERCSTSLQTGAYLNPGPRGPGPYHQTVQIIIFIINCYYIHYIHVCAHNKNQNLVCHRVHSAAVQLISPLNVSAKLLPQKQNHSVTLVRIASNKVLFCVKQ